MFTLRSVAILSINTPLTNPSRFAWKSLRSTHFTIWRSRVSKNTYPISKIATYSLEHKHNKVFQHAHKGYNQKRVLPPWRLALSFCVCAFIQSTPSWLQTRIVPPQKPFTPKTTQRAFGLRTTPSFATIVLQTPHPCRTYTTEPPSWNPCISYPLFRVHVNRP